MWQASGAEHVNGTWVVPRRSGGVCDHEVVSGVCRWHMLSQRGLMLIEVPGSKAAGNGGSGANLVVGLWRFSRSKARDTCAFSGSGWRTPSRQRPLQRIVRRAI